MSLSGILKCTLGLLPLIGGAAQAQNYISVDYPEGNVTVTAMTDQIFRVTKTAKGQEPNQYTVATFEPKSNVKTEIYDIGADRVMLLVPFSGMSATLNKYSGELVINGGLPNMLVSEMAKPASVDGRQTTVLYTTANGAFYGGGERGHSLDLRGDTLVMYNRQNYGYGAGDPRTSQMNITMPYVVASDGFGILFDDFSKSELVIGDNSEIRYEGASPTTYYYIGGGTMYYVTWNYTELVGRQPLPPLWSLGYITSKYGYHNEKETLGCIDTLRREGYPVDGIVLDLYWYGKEQDMGRLDWEKSQWPNPKKMLDRLKKDNVNVIAISQPYILRNGKGLDNYNYLAENGMLVMDSTGLKPQEVTIWVGEGGMFDMSNPKTRQWLADRYHKLTEMGVTGWWGDLGEPEVHPENSLHANGLNTEQYHNQYGNDWSQVVFDMMREHYPDTRMVTMMRGGTTGLQKYSVFPWSTDVARSWAGLKPQITIMLNSGLSGLGYMGHDVGGFAVDEENPYDAELYVRWLQLGLFSPMLRTHAQAQAEPYHYPQYADIILPLIKERYRWLPYNYTLAFDNAFYGYPLVRPLNFSYGLPPLEVDSLADEYMWGPAVLVAPVLEQGATSRKVYFPEGEWFDYYDPQRVYTSADSGIDYDAPLDKIPLFIRAGSFIPYADYEMKSTAEYRADEFAIDYYPSTIASSSLYDDNRLSASSIKKRQYRLLNFQGQTLDDGTMVIWVDSHGDYDSAPKKIKLRLAVKGMEGKTMEDFEVNNGEVKATAEPFVFDWIYTPSAGRTTITIHTK